MLPCGVTKPAARLLPMATPSTALSLSAMEPASAVTSPSFTTSNGMPPQAFCRSKKRRRMRVSNCVAAARRGRASRRALRWRRTRPRRCRRWHRRAADGRRRAAANRGRRRSDTADRLCTRGVPRHFVAEDDLAIDHGGAFAVAGAEVEADAAALQMAAERRGGFALLGARVVGGRSRWSWGGRRRGRP